MALRPPLRFLALLCFPSLSPGTSRHLINMVTGPFAVQTVCPFPQQPVAWARCTTSLTIGHSVNEFPSQHLTREPMWEMINHLCVTVRPKILVFLSDSEGRIPTKALLLGKRTVYCIRHFQLLCVHVSHFSTVESPHCVWVNRNSPADLWKVQTAITSLQICIIVPCDCSENSVSDRNFWFSLRNECRFPIIGTMCYCRNISMVHGAIYLCLFSFSGIEVIHFMYHPIFGEPL